MPEEALARLARGDKGAADIHHERHGDVLESASINKLDFATTALLGRRTEKLSAAADTELLQRKRERNEAGHTGRRNQVVATSMSDSRQGIVFSVEVDQSAT